MTDIDEPIECDICGEHYSGDLAACSICYTCHKVICIRCETCQRNAYGRRVGHELAEHLHDLHEH